MIARLGLILVMVLAASGCTQLLGLDETQSAGGDDTPIDAATDDADIPDAVPGICSPLQQATCDVDQACDVDATTQAPYCRPMGGQPALGPCGGADDCAAGTTCLGGACRTFCADDTWCGFPEDHCHLRDFIVNVCDSNCDLRLGGDGGCGGELLCQLARAPDNADWGTYCTPAVPGGLAIGENCDGDPAGCAPGSACVDINGDSAAECTQLCYVGDTTCTACGNLSDGSGLITIHGNELGVCVP